MKMKTFLAYVIVLIGSIATTTAIINACEPGEVRKLDEMMKEAAYSK